MYAKYYDNRIFLSMKHNPLTTICICALKEKKLNAFLYL